MQALFSPVKPKSSISLVAGSARPTRCTRLKTKFSVYLKSLK
jgi:hypothetical protein